MCIISAFLNSILVRLAISRYGLERSKNYMGSAVRSHCYKRACHVVQKTGPKIATTRSYRSDVFRHFYDAFYDVSQDEGGGEQESAQDQIEGILEEGAPYNCSALVVFLRGLHGIRLRDRARSRRGGSGGLRVLLSKVSGALLVL